MLWNLRVSALVWLVTLASGRQAFSSTPTGELVDIALCHSHCYTTQQKEATECITNNCPKLEELKNRIGDGEQSATACGISTGPHNLHMVCRSETKLILEWDQLRMTQSGVPIHVLEKRSRDGDWQLLVMTPWNMYEAKNLSNATEYQFQIRTVLSDGQVLSTTCSEWMTTLQCGFQPLPVKEIWSNWTLEDEEFIVRIEWQPAEDKTCTYKGVLWSGLFIRENEKIVASCSSVNVKNSPPFTCPKSTLDMVYRGLDYHNNYTTMIKGQSEDKKRESTKLSLVRKPSCYDAKKMFQLNCRPSKPVVLSVLASAQSESPQLFDFKIRWGPLMPTPLEYQVEMVTSGAESWTQVVPGHETQAVFTSVPHLGSKYFIKLRARSLGGFGPEETKEGRFESTIVKSEPVGRMDTLLPAVSVINVTTGALLVAVKEDWTTGTILTVVVGTLLVILIMAGIAVLFLVNCLRRRSCPEKNPSLEALKEKDPLPDSDPDLTADLKEATEDEWEIPEDRIILREVLGEGAFGVVYKGLLEGANNLFGKAPLDVAVKVTRENVSLQEKYEFYQEIELMKAIGRHPHVVSIIGCCTTSRMLVTEFCALGDLQHLLKREMKRLVKPSSTPLHSIHLDSSSSKEELVKFGQLASSSGNKFETMSKSTLASLVINKLYGLQNESHFPDDEPLTAADLLSFGRQVAMGMEFLASNRVVHRDLAARNVLVCSNRTVKISDFGLSRDVYEQNIYFKTTNGKLPIKWMAIESLLFHAYTTQSDVWSFGVLLWEIVTLGGNPYPNTETHQVLNLLKAGYRMQCPVNCSFELYKIMADCWKSKPKNRPTFAQLYDHLNALFMNGNHIRYLRLDLLPGQPDNAASFAQLPSYHL